MLFGCGYGGVTVSMPWIKKTWLIFFNFWCVCFCFCFFFLHPIKKVQFHILFRAHNLKFVFGAEVRVNVCCVSSYVTITLIFFSIMEHQWIMAICGQNAKKCYKVNSEGPLTALLHCLLLAPRSFQVEPLRLFIRF